MMPNLQNRLTRTDSTSYNQHMDMKDYLNESDLLGNGTCGFYRLSKGGAFHYHRQIEIIYVEKGCVTIYLGTGVLSLVRNQFAVIRPYELHDFDSKGYNKCICPILPDIYSNKLSQLNIDNCVMHDETGDALAIFKLYKTFNALSPKSRLLYFSNIYQFLENCFFHRKDSSQRISDVIFSYIHENFDRPISIESVAAACMTNHTYVSTAVNQKAHMNFNRYVNQLRLSKFIDCFDPLSDRISTAAREAGFDSVRTFYRAFQKEYSMTPGEYFGLMTGGQK